MSPSSGDGEPSLVSERVIEAVAAEMGAEPTELDPLARSVDPECLDKLFPAPTDGAEEPVRQFTFAYENHLVNVAHDGSVEVFPAGGRTLGPSPTDSATSSGRGDPETPD